MSFEEIKEVREQVAAKLDKLKNTDDVDVLELTLEELSAISGGLGDRTYPEIFGEKTCDTLEGAIAK